tara:strand:+ start:413 stop:664 length:252 start_codon:yes stop_codon:yes gene_type:complete
MAKKAITTDEKTREILIKTICSIDDLDPLMGGKWKSGMLRYYSERLAELLLRQVGEEEPDPYAVTLLAEKLLGVIREGGEVSL